MMKFDTTIWKETRFLAIWMLLFSTLMQAVFLVIGKWDYTVLTGNLLGVGTAMLNFLLMCLTLKQALEKEEADAKASARVSQLLRNLLVLLLLVIGIVLPVFHTVTVVIPIFFPRIIMMLRPMFGMEEGEEE